MDSFDSDLSSRFPSLFDTIPFPAKFCILIVSGKILRLRGRRAFRNVFLYKRNNLQLPHRISMIQYNNIRIGLVARICRSQSSQDDQFRQGRGSIPRFGIILLTFFCCLQRPPSRLSAVLQRFMMKTIMYSIGYCVLCGLVADKRSEMAAVVWATDSKAQTVEDDAAVTGLV